MKTTGKVGVDLFLPKEDDLDAVLNPMLSALTELMARPPEGASLGAILGAYQLKAKLEEQGFTIVPPRPTLRMQTASPPKADVRSRPWNAQRWARCGHRPVVRLDDFCQRDLRQVC